MQLKHYQQRVLDDLQRFLEALREEQHEYAELVAVKPKLAGILHPPKQAWEKATGRVQYHERRNGLGEPVADIYFKVPTGGGKTLLACHAIDHIQRTLLERQTGLVVWVMPSTEIYRQTARALKNRRHAYRQLLDVATGGRVFVREKDDRFTRADVEENLVILLLMLPSANRENKQSLRVFRDSGGFTDFFPPEDRYAEQEEMLTAIPNLDFFGDEETAQPSAVHRLPSTVQIKTSLGNALRVCKPLIIIDEGHKAWSDRARDTIAGLNPRFLLQLSATPPTAANCLVQVSGRDLDREQMVKLDIHLVNKEDNPDWHDILHAAIARRDELEQEALHYQQNGGDYIRPICLVQVQQTGEKLVNDLSKIHAEHVRKYLVEKCGVPERYVAVKTSENDGLEGIDLLAEDCEIRFIITQRALQEGWDCPFAYILAILSNSRSETGLTQLIGRVLRQPYARKTGIKALDECYVYTFQQSSAQLTKSIKDNLEKEGMGDIAGAIVQDDEPNALAKREIRYREQFRHFEGTIYLPKFMVQREHDGSWRDFIKEADIYPLIDWDSLDIGLIVDKFIPAEKEAFLGKSSIGYEQSKELQVKTSGLERAVQIGYGEFDMLREKSVEAFADSTVIDKGLMSRYLCAVIPNPWVSYEYTVKIVDALTEKYGQEKIAANFIKLVELAKNVFKAQVAKKAEEIFRQLISDKKLNFLLLKHPQNGYLLPSRLNIHSSGNILHHPESNIAAVQRSLFDQMPDEQFNGLERSVALCLDRQKEVLWWHRNLVGPQHYRIVGWDGQAFPDYVVSRKSLENDTDYSHVFVLETKGKHLMGNPDTEYKQRLFDLCNLDDWKHLGEGFAEKKFT
ncbi:MAG TPA: DEAD/DEAH box helicase family protein, partial [Saprospiraceae bacterium]|nr:DEAD/DEAH box helicase family protein [Saprospiraceae bacterium]